MADTTPSKDGKINGKDSEDSKPNDNKLSPPNDNRNVLSNANSSSGLFKVPKNILVSDSKELNSRLSNASTNIPASINTGDTQQRSAAPTNAPLSINNSSVTSPISNPISLMASPSATPGIGPPSSLQNKNIISSLNKSLKAKQKIINSREPHPKNSTLITEMMNTSPQSTVFPNNISNQTESEENPVSNTPHPNTPINPGNQQSQTTSTTHPPPNLANPVIVGLSHPQPSNQLNNLSNATNTQTTSNTTTPNTTIGSVADLGSTSNLTNQTSLKGKHKKIAKQSSTRTDFFAAKLASAVDDIESSDSDETFVYENNNANEYETISNANNVITTDTSSIQGSVAGGASNAPALNSPPVADQNLEFPLPPSFPSSNFNHVAESVHSVHSNSRGPKNNVGNISTPSSNRPPSISNSYNSNVYLESIMNNSNNLGKDKKLSHQRSSSSYSTPLDELNKTIQNSERSSVQHSPLSQFGDVQGTANSNPHSNHHSLGLLDPTNRSFHHGTSSQRAHSVNDYNDEHYSYDEVDDDDENLDDDVSIEGDYYASRPTGSTNAAATNRLTSSSENNSGNAANGSTQNAIDNSNQHAHPFASNNSVTSKNTSKKNYKSSTSSSKLRSTTSKLFDKKGSQPRRYSIIPDDIDIEDFDDELIYYDNNIRFPYNTNNNNLNEYSPLISQGHRLPHYRSLNLNFPGTKRPSTLKNKRYMSTGQAVLPDNGHTDNPALPPNKDDMFSYQYQDPQEYYYDFDEYDEEEQAGNNHNEHNQRPRNSSRKINNGGGRYTHPHLSPSANHFFLPRKQSSEFKHYRANCIKSFIYTLVSIVCILGVGFMMGFVLATTKELQHVSITSIESPVVSQDELIFNVVVRAFNPGWFAVNIDEVELDIFAKSGYLSDSIDLTLENAIENVLIGTVTTLESPLSFSGGFFTREAVSQTGEIKLLSPGRNLTNTDDDLGNVDGDNDPDNSKKWQVIAKHPFDLRVRGVLKYNLPMSSNPRSVVVDKVQYIDPSAQ